MRKVVFFMIVFFSFHSFVKADESLKALLKALEQKLEVEKQKIKIQQNLLDKLKLQENKNKLLQPLAKAISDLKKEIKLLQENIKQMSNCPKTLKDCCVKGEPDRRNSYKAFLTKLELMLINREEEFNQIKYGDKKYIEKLLQVTTTKEGKTKAIYGTDDRHNPSKETDKRVKTAAESTVALAMKSQSGRLGKNFCSGSLISDDLILTCHHCIEEFKGDKIKNVVVEFNDEIGSSADIDVYPCKEIVLTDRTERLDFAIIRVGKNKDDALPGISYPPLALIERTPKKNDALVVIGHPIGWTKKIAGNAKIVRTRYFPEGKVAVGANCDTFKGNSGSAAFYYGMAKTLGIFGILWGGQPDFDDSGEAIFYDRATRKVHEYILPITDVIAKHRDFLLREGVKIVKEDGPIAAPADTEQDLLAKIFELLERLLNLPAKNKNSIRKENIQRMIEELANHSKLRKHKNKLRKFINNIKPGKSKGFDKDNLKDIEVDLKAKTAAEEMKKLIEKLKKK